MPLDLECVNVWGSWAGGKAVDLDRELNVPTRVYRDMLLKPLQRGDTRVVKVSRLSIGRIDC